ANIDDFAWQPFVMGLAVLGLLFLVTLLLPRIPAPPVAIAVATIVTFVFDLPEHGIPVVGTIPRGRPEVALPSFAPGAPGALLLPVRGHRAVASPDTALTAPTLAGRHRPDDSEHGDDRRVDDRRVDDTRADDRRLDEQQVDSTQELLALGAANIGSSLVHG